MLTKKKKKKELHFRKIKQLSMRKKIRNQLSNFELAPDNKLKPIHEFSVEEEREQKIIHRDFYPRASSARARRICFEIGFSLITRKRSVTLSCPMLVRDRSRTRGIEILS